MRSRYPAFLRRTFVVEPCGPVRGPHRLLVALGLAPAPHLYLLFRALLFGFLLLVVVISPYTVSAQSPDGQGEGLARAATERPVETLSRDKVEDLIATLEDPAARQAFVERLRILVAASEEANPTSWQSPRTHLLSSISAGIGAANEDLGQIVSTISRLPQALTWARSQLADPAARRAWLEGGLQLAVALLIASALGLGGRYTTRRGRRLVQVREGAALWRRLASVACRVFFDAVPIVLFAVGGYLALGLLGASSLPRLAALTLINGIVLVAVARLVGKTALGAGSSPGLLDLGEQTAGYLFRWLCWFAYVAVFGYLAAEAALAYGVGFGPYLGLTRLVGAGLSAMVIALVVQNRTLVARHIAGREWQLGVAETAATGRIGKWLAMQRLRLFLASIWHVLAGAYVAVAYLIWALRIEDGFAFLIMATLASAAIVSGATVIVTLSDRLFLRRVEMPPPVRLRAPGLEARLNVYWPILGKLVKFAVWAAALLSVLLAWGIDVFAWFALPAGRSFGSAVLSIAFVLVCSLVIWEVVSNLIEGFLSGSVHPGARIERSARVRTLLPLLRHVFFAVLLTFVVLICLSQIGINIAPLLAGAGVVGLAIGVGAQALVKDVINGMFILFEDTVSVGDVVNVGDGHGGVVEALSIRSMRLRDLSGSVHTVPFGAVAAITNMTRNFSYYVFNIGIAYKEDVDRVIEVIRQLGQDMQEDPEYRDTILEPIEMLGVDAFSDSAVIIKARVKTQPIKQWLVGREFNRRLKRRFDELQIEIPFPHRTIFIREEGASLRSASSVRAKSDRNDSTAATRRRPRRTMNA